MFKCGQPFRYEWGCLNVCTSLDMNVGNIVHIQDLDVSKTLMIMNTKGVSKKIIFVILR